MAEWVVDASAVLAVIRRERGADRVWPRLADALMSSVNLAEAASVLVKSGYEMSDARSALEQLSMRIIDFDRQQAFEAARLRPLTASRGLSLADRACLALGHIRGAPVLTADREWQSLELDVAIELIS